MKMTNAEIELPPSREENKEVSNFEKFGSCEKCPVDNTDPFQLPGACHRCLDIRGL